MLLKILLSLSAVCWGQNQQLPITSLQDTNAQQAVQNALNTKFSVAGGTITGSVSLTTATINGTIVFSDGSTLSSAYGLNISTLSFSNISYSSGTVQSFQAVFNSTSSYEWQYSISVTSGTNSTNSTFLCTINGDSTAADYKENLQNYPNAYNVTPGLASLSLNSCGGGAVSTGDMVFGSFKVSPAWGTNNILAITGGWTETCQGKTI